MRLAWLVSLLIAPALTGQVPRVGVIDFFGLHRVNQERLRKALGVKEGDTLPGSKSDVEERLETIAGVVRARLEATCCEDGKAILYVGIEEKGAPHFDFRPAPEGTTLLPLEIVEAYEHFLEAVRDAVKRGETAEDLSRGHSLMVDADSRTVQEQFVALAGRHVETLRQVLRNSADQEQRAIAAYVIGYAPNKSLIVDDLQYAMRDPDDTVRSNAMRALGAIAVLAREDPEQGIRFSVTWFVEMLHSLIWTDRNNAAVALVNFTEKRDQRTLDLLKERALPSLAEMARWKHLPHALPAFILLGRIAGLPESEVQDHWNKGDREAVVKRATAAGTPAGARSNRPGRR